MKATKKTETGFEKDLEKLEAIVATLEEGGLPLEKSLKEFEVGIQLTRKCEKALRQAEQKIEMLVRGMDGDLEAEDFDEDNAKAAQKTPTPRQASAPVEAASVATPPSEEAPPDEVYEGEDGEEDMDALF